MSCLWGLRKVRDTFQAPVATSGLTRVSDYAEQVPRSWQNEWFHSPRPPAKPFLKWAGGKRRLVSKLVALIGPLHEGSTYFEPFLGSGAVFFALQPPRAVLSDLNPALVESYRVVKSRPPELCALLETLPPRPTRDQYYTTRERFNEILSQRTSLTVKEQLELASLFIWLNHTCFNGLYRVNRTGLFNVPMGSSPDPHIFDESTIQIAARALRSSQTELHCSDYRKVLSRARDGDRVYLDPPYESPPSSPGFTDYTSSGFSPDDQTRLAEFVGELAERGVRVVLSNSNFPRVRALYKRYTIHLVTSSRSISRNASGRGRVKEVVVVA
jgi:DNA adenine methylase